MVGCDLEEFKLKLKKFKKNHKYKNIEDLKNQLVRNKIFSEEEVAFHSDWLEDDSVKRKNNHRSNKDNPYAVFRKLKNGDYKWSKVSSRYNNSRYINAINHSAGYLKGTFWDSVK